LRTPRGGLREVFTVREVRLWGKWVLIDELHDVYCEDCWRFVSVEELGHPFNPHRVGLPARDAIVRVEFDDELPQRRPWADEVGF
jgi:hypothetical protein